MSPKTATPLDSLPVGRLGIIPLKSCEKLGNKVSDYIVKWRKDRDHQGKENMRLLKVMGGFTTSSAPRLPASAPARQKEFCRNLSAVMTCISWWMCAPTLSLILCAEKLTICPRMTISRI